MSILESINLIKSNVASSCELAHRSVDDVTIVAVSKFQDVDNINIAISAGIRVFGENRVQEAQLHWQGLRLKYPEIKLHFIGSLQTNKVDDAVELFDVIETVDSKDLANEIIKQCNKKNKKLDCFIQVNTGNEIQKSGVGLSELPDLLNHCRNIGLNITGLMCIPPQSDPPAFHFALLKKLAKRYNLPHLSMGMSADYERAIELGATHIRIGTALFGARCVK